MAHLDKNLPLEYQSHEDRMTILGFWIFLGAEIALFSTLFATYLVLETHTAGGPSGFDLFEAPSVIIMTLLLLTSSFTCGIAIWYMRRENKKGLIGWLIVTLLLGAGFLYMEVSEFAHYIEHGATMQTSAFLSAFFVLTGTHGFHVTMGIGWATLLIIQLARNGLNHTTARKVFVIGLYWHFLDVVWIFLFTLVYVKGMVG